MNRRPVAALVGAAAFVIAPQAWAGSGRVLIAGPEGDPLASRVQKELVAMGFDAIRSDAAEGCSRSAVATRVEVERAVAATCSDGAAIVVYVVERNGLRLRDVVSAPEGARDTAAVRAAEITRASLELREAEPPPPPPPENREPIPTFVRATPAEHPPVPPPAGRTPLFDVGVGMGALMGVDASVGTFSGRVDLGITRYVALALHVEWPLEQESVSSSTGDAVKLSPGFVGAGFSVPIAPPASFVIPRFGGGGGYAWIRGVPDSSFSSSGNFFSGEDATLAETPVTTTKSDTVGAFALYADAGLSMRILGPVRLGVDGILGATTSRLVVRSNGTQFAFWGTPFGSLALRLEAMAP